MGRGISGLIWLYLYLAERRKKGKKRREFEKFENREAGEFENIIKV